MSIEQIVLTCDYCMSVEGGFEDVLESTRSGWFILQGPDIILGRDEKAYCSLDCLRADL